MNNFKLAKLSELVIRVKVGFVGSINEYYCEKENGIPLIRTTDIDELGINYSSLKYVTKEFHIKNKKSQIKKGDLIIARHGENGKANVFKEEFDAQVLNAVIIETDQNKVESNLLKYYFDSPFVKKQILGVVKGSVQGVINTAHIADVLIPISNKINYKGLSKIINDLDSKIELNNRINSELEAMAKTLYDYWFVQFDFPDKNGKPYKTNGGKMIWNEELKREIPEGWGVLDLEKVENNIITGKTPSTTNPNFYNGHIPFITIGDVRGNMHIVSTVQKLTIDGANQQANKFIPKGAICVTCIASPGLVGFATEESQTNQQLNSVVCKNYENRYFLYFYLTDYFKYSSAKTGNTFANMNKGDFASIKVIKPQKDILINFSNVLNSTIEKILNNSLENQKLTELRDWLLPMLMNGQVKVN